MSTPPTKRLLVYVIAGLVVLIVGALGLLSMASGRGDDGVVIDAVSAVDEAMSLAAGAEPGGEQTASQDGRPSPEGDEPGSLDRIAPDREYIAVYASRRLSPADEGAGAEPSARPNVAQADPHGEGPQVQGFTSERARLAEEALANASLPVELQNVVRRYFTPDSP